MKNNFYTNEPYIIAETAYSFEGDSDYLLRQTNQLSSQIDAIKYHMLLNIDEYMVKTHEVYNGLKDWIISSKDWMEILTSAKKNKLDTVILVDDIASIDFCMNNHQLIDAIEIHAACVNDLELLDRAIQFSIDFDKLFVLGISGFEIQELLEIREYLIGKRVKDVLMIYGFQNYPTTISEVNLKKIKVLEEILNFKIGYADHTEFSNKDKELLIYSSYAMGSNVQEIHYVLDEGYKRTDYITAISNERLIQIKNNLITINDAMGAPDFRLNEGEKKYLDFRKIPLYKHNYKESQVIDSTMIYYKRVQSPLRKHSFLELDTIIGKSLNKSVEKDTEVFIEDFE